MKFYNCYDNKPPKVVTKLDTDTCFVSQSEAQTSSLAYQLKRYGMDTLQARFEAMKDKFGYADCTQLNDFAELQNKYRSSVEYFEALPSEMRRQYNDNPEVFYESISKNPKLAYQNGFISEEKYKSMVSDVPVAQKNDTVDINEVVNDKTSAKDVTDTSV